MPGNNKQGVCDGDYLWEERKGRERGKRGFAKSCKFIRYSVKDLFVSMLEIFHH